MKKMAPGLRRGDGLADKSLLCALCELCSKNEEKRGYMKNLLLALLALLAAVPAFAAGEGKESTYDRVMRTGVIKCGYINYPPHFMIDPTTGEKSGIMHDIVTEAAELLQFKVEWAEELGWGNTVEALRSGRIDAVCTSFWQNPVEGKYLGFTMPLFYSAVGAYVHKDKAAKLSSVSTLNDPAVTISGTDGNMSDLIARQEFPKAKWAAHPNMTDETEQLMDVLHGKADVTFVETYLGETFSRNNESKLVNIAKDNPVRLFGNTIAIAQDDVRFKSMMDSVLVQLLYGGRVEKIIRKYEDVPGGIYRAARPYEMPK